MTLQELITMALRDIGYLDAVETVAAEDYAFVSTKFRLALAQLSMHGLDVWDLTDTPDEYAQAFVNYTAPMFAGAYGYSIGGDIREAQKASLAWLKDLIKPRRLSSLKKNEYF